MGDDPIWENVRPFPKGKKNDKGEPLSVLWIETDDWIEEDILKRPWIAKGYLLRGAVSVLAGAGSAGKSMLSIGYSVALAFGEAWGRFIPTTTCRVMLVNAEDDADEQKLRLSAVLRTFGRVPRDLAGKVARVGFNTAGPLVDFDAQAGTAVPTSSMANLIEHIKAFRPDVVVIDPMVEMHTANENDNQALRAVVSVFRDVAREHKCAVLIVHHARKGSGAMAGDADMIRGAGAIVGAARVALTCCVMTEDEANDLGVVAKARSNYFRVDGAKSNYASLREVEWYERVEHTLDNGEEVSAAVPWFPPKQECTAADLDLMVEHIGRAIPPYSPRLSEKEDRSILHLLVSLGYLGRASQEAALVALERDRGVSKARCRRPGKGKNDFNLGLRTAQGEPAHAPWLD